MARVRNLIPAWRNSLLALASAVLLILAFPDFEYWFLAWFALVPLMWAVERQTERGHSCPHDREAFESSLSSGTSVRPSGSWGQECPRSFLLGWIFGTAFFFGTCWWLTYAPIHYASMPWPIAYFLIFIVCLISGLFPAVFTTLLSILIRRFGSWAFLAAPFVWVFTEFLRYWLTGNNWNAIGYSQAFTRSTIRFAEYGGVELVGFVLLIFASAMLVWLTKLTRYFSLCFAVLVVILVSDVTTIGVFKHLNVFEKPSPYDVALPPSAATVIAIQPNVPASGMDSSKSEEYRRRQFVAVEEQIRPARPATWPTLAILPESPMNFMYTDDREFQQFIGDFARRNNVSVLFNSAEPDRTNGKYFNSAVMVGPDGKEAAQYDKIYLLPFGEAVPPPLDRVMPGFVGSFSYGGEYDLLPVGDAKAGVMICFESHFGQLSREYVKNGADVIIEMTNDGYLGPTPVLRQHLANAVFRAVETNRPVLRVTNVGITAYITETGQVIDPAPTYQEATRTWSVSKSDGSQTFYVKYGDWFAWLCTGVTVVLVVLSFRRRKKGSAASLDDR